MYFWSVGNLATGDQITQPKPFLKIIHIVKGSCEKGG